MHAFDLHVHSFHSGDNDTLPEEYIEKALKLKLSGIAFTEHYSYMASEHVESLRDKFSRKITILRGVEFSSSDGHCLIFGVNTDKLNERELSLQKLIDLVNSLGGVAIPSHPFRGANSAGELTHELKGLVALEGYNGCSMHFMNEKAISVATSLGIGVIGGSDAHSTNELGSCITVFNGNVNENNFLDQLRSKQYQAVDNRKIGRFWPF